MTNNQKYNLFLDAVRIIRSLADAKTGNFTGIGVFTIIAEENGQGASRWGKLKSGAGWISLDYAKRI